MRSALARSSSPKENMRGVITDGWESRICDDSSSTFTPALNSPRAAAILRRLVERISPLQLLVTRFALAALVMALEIEDCLPCSLAQVSAQ